MNTLVADDNSEIRAALRFLLEELGEGEMTEAADKGQALAALEHMPIDVVLLDWELPDGGYPCGDSGQFVRELKRKAPDCLVIAMSGAPEAHGSSLRAGCDAFVSRNDPPDRLLALLGVGREASGSKADGPSATS
jgi:CheY-like chemotaxis protein